METNVSGSFLRRWSASVGRQFVSSFCGLLFLSALPAQAGPVPQDKPDNYPAWWFQQGVILPLNSSNQSPSWLNHDYPAPDDFAVANVGQLKQIATQAARAMNVALSTGAGSDINSLVLGWLAPAASGVQRDDFAALNRGQLKVVAKLFYDELIANNLAATYPWAGGTPDDFGAVNLGQLKNVFSFNLPAGGGGTAGGGGSNPGNPNPFGIPASWWSLYGLTPVDSSTLSPDGHLTYLQKYQNGLNPNLLDTDGDGIPDFLELTAGTNPLKKDAPPVQLQVTIYTTP